MSLIFPAVNHLRVALIAMLVVLMGCAGPEEKAQSYYQRGNEFLAKKEFAKAGIEFRNALQLKKDLVGAWRGLLQIEEQSRDAKAQVPLLRNIVELDPKDVTSKIKLGHFLLAANALDQSLDLANAALDLDSKSPTALTLRGAVLLKLGDEAGAKRDAEAALQLDPAAAEPLIVLAAERQIRGDIDGAIAILDRDSQGKNTAVQIFKLALFEKKGDLQKVEAVLRNLIAMNPAESVYRSALVKLYIKQKRIDDAEKELRALAVANPSSLKDGLNVVRFVLQTKGAISAREELENRIKAGGEVFPYQIALAEFDFAQGHREDAIASLEALSKTAKPTDSLIARTKLAELHLRLRQVEPAQQLLTDILRKDARNVEALKLQGALKLDQGKIDEAIASLREALNDQPRSSELMGLLATAYERSGSIELAEKQYADATNVSSYDPAVGLQYVSFLRRRGNFERAEDVLNELVRRSPNNTRVLTALADVKLARQDWAGAQKIAETIQRTVGSGGAADQITASALSAQGDFNSSIRILENTYSARPGNSALVALVGTMLRSHQVDKAEGLLQGVLKQNPNNAEAHVLMGSVLLAKNSPKQALEQFNTAIKQQPKLADAYVALAGYHLREKNYDEAEKVLHSGLAQAPDDVSLRMNVAGIYEIRKDYDRAISEYETLWKQQPGSLVIANNLASLLSDQRADKATVERAYSVASILRKSPVAAFKDTLGWIYYLRGDAKTAIPLLEEAATALSDRGIVQYHLGMSYLADGQLEKASGQFKKALGLNPDPGLQGKIRAAQEKAAM
jgi:tetratricopeptide (TPR) repeat protein